MAKLVVHTEEREGERERELKSFSLPNRDAIANSPPFLPIKAECHNFKLNITQSHYLRMQTINVIKKFMCTSIYHSLMRGEKKHIYYYYRRQVGAAVFPNRICDESPDDNRLDICP